MLNLCPGTTHGIGDVLEAMIAASGLDVRMETDPERCRPAGIPDAVGDTARSGHHLDWRPANNLDGIVRVLLALLSER